MRELSPSEIDDLLLEFKKIEGWKQKLNFWKQKLEIDYLNLIIKDSSHPYLSIFNISIKKNQWASFNKVIIDYLGNYQYELPIEFKLLKLNELVKAFKKKLKTAVNKRELLLKEIKIIETSFQKSSPINFNFPPNYKFSFQFNSDYNIYANFRKYEEVPDYNLYRPSLSVVQIENGKILAMYHQYLENELKNRKGSIDKVEDKLILTTKQVAMVLHYSTILESLNFDTTVKSKLFSSLLNISEKNLYDAIREVPVNKNRSEGDLKAVLNFFEEHKLARFIRQVKVDLAKLTNR